MTRNSTGKTYVRIMESVRKGEKVFQKTLMSLGWCKDDEALDALKQTAQKMVVKLSNDRKPSLPGLAEIVYGKEPDKKTPSRRKQAAALPGLFHTKEQKRVIHGIGGVCGVIYEQMGFHTIIQETYKDRQWNEYLKACVLSRVAHPQSKRKTVETLELDYNQKIPLEKVYRMMDRLYANKGRVKSLVAQNTLSLFKQEVDILFFDVTTLYFESFTPDELRRFGFSKDQKFRETQVVLALVTNFEGHPLSYELFPGNTSEGSTLISAVESLRKSFNIHKVVLVADRAMFSRKNLKFMEESGFQYVVAARLKSFPKERREWILSRKARLEGKSEEPGFERFMEWEEKKGEGGRRFIVSYSSKRQLKDQSDRKRLIERLLKKVKKGQVPVKSLISNYGTKKYITVDKTAKARLNEGKIREEARFDGLHGVVTNIQGRKASELLSRYRGLWRIEEAFRVSKHTLKMRPVYHWTKRRVEAHIAICFLAYSLSYMMKYRLERAGLKFSIEKLREVLKRDQYSVIEDTRTKKLYRFPSKFTEPIRAIYEAFGLKRVSEITPLS